MFRFWHEILAGICVGFCPFEHLLAYIWELKSWKGCKFHPISKLRRVALRTKWTRHERTRKRRRSNGSKQLQLHELVRHCWSFAWEAYLCGQFMGRCCGFKPLSPAWIHLDSASFRPNLAIVLGSCLSWRDFLLLDLWRSVCWSVLNKHLHRLDRGIRIYLNCGDHGHIADAIIAKLQVGIWSWKIFRFEIWKHVLNASSFHGRYDVSEFWLGPPSTPATPFDDSWFFAQHVGNVNFSLLMFVGLILGLERSYQQWGHSAALQEGGLRKVGGTCRLEGAGPDRKSRDFSTGRET